MTMDLMLVLALVASVAIALYVFSRRPARTHYRELDKILRKPGRPVPPPHSIFLSYRRKDSGDTVGRLFEHLSRAYSHNAVFKDVDAIALGQDFRTALDEALSKCRVFLCVIGPQWPGPLPQGGTALSNPEDFVRLEVETALRRGVLVIPVMVHNTPLPQPDSLPESLRELVYRQAQPLRADPDFNTDVARLCKRLDGVFDGSSGSRT